MTLGQFINELRSDLYRRGSDDITAKELGWNAAILHVISTLNNFDKSILLNGTENKGASLTSDKVLVLEYQKLLSENIDLATTVRCLSKQIAELMINLDELEL